jgi:hypothetical protein
LEAKFVAANTLIGINSDLSLADQVDSVRNMKQQLKTSKHKIFSAKTVRTKRKYKQQVNELRMAIANELESLGFINTTETNQLASWDMFDQNASSPFFDTDWMFGVRGGFDIVIGNPPFIDIKGLPNDDVRKYFNIFKTTENRINLYSIFIEKGHCLCSNNGILCYINPNSILMNESYLKIRRLIFNNVAQIIKLPDHVFQSVNVETIILLLNKSNIDRYVYAHCFNNNEKVTLQQVQLNPFDRFNWENDTDLRFNIFANNEILTLLSKIEAKGVPLENYMVTSLGITPYDKYKGHDANTIKNRLFHSNSKIDGSYVPLISGKNIHSYFVSNEIKEYLRYGEWLGAPREQKFFTSEKIIVRQIVGEGLKIIAGYSNEPHYFTQIGFSLLSRTHDSKQLKIILAILNSSLMSFYHKNKYLDTQKVLFQKVLIANTKKLPIVLPEDSTQINILVDAIIAAYKNNDSNTDTTSLEQEIDLIVYKLYGLTYEEVQVVDPETPITEEEYNKE